MSPVGPDARPFTTLVVDDHTLFRKGLVNLLRNRGIAVLAEANDGRAGIEQAVRLNPDLILMDVNMPACNGVEAMRAIHQRLPDAKVLMLTERDDDANLCSAVQAGAKGYVLKTADVDELVGAIERVMKGEAVIPRAMAPRFLDEYPALAKGGVPLESPPRIW